MDGTKEAKTRAGGAAGGGARMTAAALALAMLLASLGTSIANIALPALKTAFAADFAVVQAVVVAYLGALTLTVVVAGRLGDRHGLRRMLLVGLGLFALASLLCGLAPGLAWLIAARALQGVGAGFLMTLAMALMRETATAERLGRAMGLLGTVSALGTALGPVLGGVLVGAAGWRAIFLVQVPLALLGFVLVRASLPEVSPPEVPPQRNRAGRPRQAIDGGLARGLVVNLLVAAVMMATLVVGPFYLGAGLGLTAAMAGLVMAVGPMISIVGGVPAGRLVDARGARAVLALGLGLLTAGAFLLALLPGVAGIAGYVLAIAVLTPGYQLFQAANNTAVLAEVAADRRGMVSGLLGLSRNLGLIAGASVLGAVFAWGAGGDLGQAAGAEIAAGLRLTFVIAGGLMLLALALAFGRRGGFRLPRAAGGR